MWVIDIFIFITYFLSQLIPRKLNKKTDKMPKPIRIIFVWLFFLIALLITALLLCLIMRFYKMHGIDFRTVTY